MYGHTAATELAALGGAVGESLVAADLASLVSHKRTARGRSSSAALAALAGPAGAHVPWALSPKPPVKLVAGGWAAIRLYTTFEDSTPRISSCSDDATAELLTRLGNHVKGSRLRAFLHADVQGSGLCRSSPKP